MTRDTVSKSVVVLEATTVDELLDQALIHSTLGFIKKDEVTLCMVDDKWKVKMIREDVIDD